MTDPQLPDAGPELKPVQPAGGGQPTGGVLPPEHRAKFQALFEWMRPVWESGGPYSEPRRVIDAASRGERVEFIDYSAEMKEEQRSWKLGGSVSRSWAWWDRMFPEERVLMKRLREGFRWDWFEEEWEIQAAKDDNPDLDFRDRRPQRLRGDRATSFKDVIFEGLTHGFIGLDPDPSRPGWIVLAFSIPKADPTDFRWLLDLRACNVLIKKPKFKMTTDEHLRQELDRDAFIAVLDFKKFFWLFDMHPSEVWFQRFWGPDLGASTEDGAMCDVLHRMLVCPMGNRMSPKMTCDYPNLLVKKFQEFGFQLMSYVDECAVWSTDCVVTYLAMMMFVVVANRLGLALSYPKLVYRPTQRAVFLGWVLDATLLRCSLSEERRVALEKLAAEILTIRREDGKIPIKMKAQFQGVLVAARPGLRQAGMLLAWLNVEVKQDLQAGEQDYDHLCSIRCGLARAATFAANIGPEKNWAYFRNEVPSVSASADASEHAYCAHLVDPGVGEASVSVETRDLIQDCLLPEELELHHNIKEYLGVTRGLRSLTRKHRWLGSQRLPKCMSCETDSRTVLACFNNGRTRSLGCASRHLKFMRYLEKRGLQTTMTFLAGDLMVSARRTDEGSRFRTPWWKWRLQRKIVQRVCRVFQTRMSDMVDLFSEESSRQFPRFVTMFTQPEEALWTDALTRPWSARRNPLLRRTDSLWVFPPPRLLRKCLRQWEEDPEALDMILIMPVKNQFLTLSRLSGWLAATPIVLPSVKKSMIDADGHWASKTSSPVAATPAGLLMACLTSHRHAGRRACAGPVLTIGADGTLTSATASTTLPTSGPSSSTARTKMYIRTVLAASSR